MKGYVKPIIYKEDATEYKNEIEQLLEDIKKELRENETCVSPE